MKLFFPCSVLLILLGLFYLPVLRDLGYIWWNDPNYSHGFLVPCITAYLLWSRKATLDTAVIKPSAWGSLALAVGLVLCFVGEAAALAGGEKGTLFLKGLSLILVLAGLLLLLFGPAFLKSAVFPLAYLVFMLPLPESLLTLVTVPLQDYTTKVTTSVLQLLRVPALREGNLIHLSSVTLGIVEACSGVRSLFTLLAGAVALSALTLTQAVAATDPRQLSSADRHFDQHLACHRHGLAYPGWGSSRGAEFFPWFVWLGRAHRGGAALVRRNPAAD